MIKKIFKIYLILSCLDHICITTQSQEEESGCAVYFNLFRWLQVGSCCFWGYFLLLLDHVEKLMWNIKKSLLFWCHLTLAQSRDEWSLQNRKKILNHLNGLENLSQRACNLFPGIPLALLGKAFLLLTCLFAQSWVCHLNQNDLDEELDWWE